ncbi:unnamed protein product [Ilex paraguariensis]|uniref:ADP/ATP translocase n=1 Tax=Ilex paraguariensis TaxID=185542 RepID=A0ABC8V5D9_9AQUA
MGEGVLLWLVNRSKDSAINKVGRLKLAVQFLMIESVKHLATKITFFNSRKCFKDGALRAIERLGERLEMTRQSERFSVDFVMAGATAIISKSAAAPIERVKLLLQNQGELLKRGHLMRPYTGVGDCFRRVLREEGLFSFWRGNQANVIRYFPTQVNSPLPLSYLLL